MVKKSTKVLSLVFAAAVALVLLLGMPSSTSEGATYNINAPGDWAGPLILADGDILNIAAAAGSPPGDFVIYIAADANVRINGAGNTINNVRLADDPGDTVAHTVTINNLNISTTAGEGYINVKGVLNVIGTNSITAGTNTGIYNNTLGPVTIKAENNGTLNVTSSSLSAIFSAGLILQQGVTVNLTGGNSGSLLASDGVTMSPGTTLILKNNMLLTDFTQKFVMSAAGNQWVVTDATIVSPATATSSTANIKIAMGGATGKIVLASQPGITGPTAGSLTEGYAASESAAFTLTGSPLPTVTVAADAKITWNNTTKKLNVAPGLAAGIYPVVLTASNGFDPAATANFELTVVTGVTVTGVTVAPSAVDVVKGGTQTFTATVTGTGSPATTVTWTVTGGITGTSIDSAGVLTVAEGETAATLTVKATSTVDTTKSGTATVTVTEPASEKSGTSIWLWISIAVVIIIIVVYVLFTFVLKKP